MRAILYTPKDYYSISPALQQRSRHKGINILFIFNRYLC
jgi:hypothetical protein